MRYSKILLLCLAFLTSSLQISPALAKESFKDEAGEVLYTVDDDGLVSMFENSPGTDVTLTVTRVATAGPPAAEVADALAGRPPAAAVLGDLPARWRTALLHMADLFNTPVAAALA